jgi:hypothetical protein
MRSPWLLLSSTSGHDPTSWLNLDTPYLACRGEVIDCALSVVLPSVTGNLRLAPPCARRRRLSAGVDDQMAGRAQTAPCCAKPHHRNQSKRDLLDP